MMFVLCILIVDVIFFVKEIILIFLLFCRIFMDSGIEFFVLF